MKIQNKKFCYNIIVLFLGYLEELKCSRAAQEFLESSPLLSECLAAHNNGRRIISRVCGRTLNQIIDDHCDAHTLSKYCY
jgi:hypothetical protein